MGHAPNTSPEVFTPVAPGTTGEQDGRRDIVVHASEVDDPEIPLSILDIVAQMRGANEDLVCERQDLDKPDSEPEKMRH